MKTKKEREHERSLLSGRLISRFVTALLASALLEYMMQRFVNRYILQGLTERFFTVPASVKLSAGQIAVLFAASIARILLRSLAALIRPMASGITVLETAVSNWVYSFFPWEMTVESLGAAQSLVLSVTMFLTLLLLFLPLLVIGVLYSHYVMSEMDKIRAEEEKEFRILAADRHLMLSDLVHDIRNPLTTVIGCTEALQSGKVRDAAQREDYLRAIREKAGRMNDLVTLLFDYAALSSTGFRLNRTEIDLAELLRKTAAGQYGDAEERGMEIAPDIPDEKVVVEGDALQLSRLFVNLLDNVMKYNPEGTRILVRLRDDRKESGDIFATVADTGIAIDDETAEKIFEPFYRSDKARPTGGGSGLGLSIAGQIAQLHGWELSYSKEIPGYTKGFVLRIPW